MQRSPVKLRRGRLPGHVRISFATLAAAKLPKNKRLAVQSQPITRKKLDAARLRKIRHTGLLASCSPTIWSLGESVL
jgi:hypothetical protein